MNKIVTVNEDGQIVEREMTSQELFEHEEYIKQLKAQDVELSYSEKRVAEYPSIAEYIDGLVKGDQSQIDAYIAACLAVKAKYPKPE